jgi:hypothetical protein
MTIVILFHHISGMQYIRHYSCQQWFQLSCHWKVFTPGFMAESSLKPKWRKTESTLNSVRYVHSSSPAPGSVHFLVHLYSARIQLFSHTYISMFFYIIILLKLKRLHFWVVVMLGAPETQFTFVNRLTKCTILFGETITPVMKKMSFWNLKILSPGCTRMDFH